MELTNNILPENLIHAAVDGIIYRGDCVKTDSDVYIGCLRKEIEDADFIMRGANAYMFFSNGKCIEMKHGAYDENLISDEPLDIFKWSKKQKKLEEGVL